MTTTNITAVSPSTFSPISSRKLLRSRKVSEWTSGPPPVTKCQKMPSEMTSPAPTATIPTSAPLPGILLPKKTIRKKAASGRDGISQANFTI